MYDGESGRGRKSSGEKVGIDAGSNEGLKGSRSGYIESGHQGRIGESVVLVLARKEGRCDGEQGQLLQLQSLCFIQCR